MDFMLARLCKRAIANAPSWVKWSRSISEVHFVRRHPAVTKARRAITKNGPARGTPGESPKEKFRLTKPSVPLEALQKPLAMPQAISTDPRSAFALSEEFSVLRARDYVAFSMRKRQQQSVEKAETLGAQAFHADHAAGFSDCIQLIVAEISRMRARKHSSPDTGPGLTDLGKELIRACNQLKILIDLSHWPSHR